MRGGRAEDADRRGGRIDDKRSDLEDSDGTGGPGRSFIIIWKSLFYIKLEFQKQFNTKKVKKEIQKKIKNFDFFQLPSIEIRDAMFIWKFCPDLVFFKKKMIIK